MKLIDIVDFELSLFEVDLFLKLLYKKKQNNPYRSLSPDVTFGPMILCRKPKLYDASKGYFELIIRIQMSEEQDNPNSDKVIVETVAKFIFSYEDGISKKELFEKIIWSADELSCQQYFAFISLLKIKFKTLNENHSKNLQECEYNILKLGTKYRPLPNVDYDDFFLL